MSGPVYSPLVETYPTTAAELAAFGATIPDEGQRRLALAIANAMMTAEAARTAAANARQMVLNRDPRLDTFDERYTALSTLLDQQAAVQKQLQAVADTAQTSTQASATDRAEMRQMIAALTARVDAFTARKMTLAVATTMPPLLSLGTRDVTFTWSRNMVDANYQVEYILGDGLLGKATAKTKTLTATTCTATITNTAILGIGVGASITAVAWRYA